MLLKQRLIHNHREIKKAASNITSLDGFYLEMEERVMNDEAGLLEVAPDSIAEVIRLEQREKSVMTRSDLVADLLTRFSGSMLFVALHALWFSGWIALNVVTNGFKFDEYPFGLLTMLVSLESIFLSTFVLIAQNRQAVLSDKRAKLDLQVNLISESEVTKLIQMMEDIRARLGINEEADEEVLQMKRPTHVRDLANQMEELEQLVDKESAKGPTSAADTDT